MKVSNEEFSREVYLARKTASSDAEFMKLISKYDHFDIFVDRIIEITEAWAKDVGLIKVEAPKEAKLTAIEVVYKKYWDNHSFPDIETQRNLADLVELLTGVPQGRFIKAKKTSRGSFFRNLICIVPKANEGGHNYQLGVPILKYGGSSGKGFLKTTGSMGNSMDTSLESIALPTKEQVQSMVTNALFRTSSAVDDFIGYLINDWEGV